MEREIDITGQEGKKKMKIKMSALAIAGKNEGRNKEGQRGKKNNVMMSLV